VEGNRGPVPGAPPQRPRQQAIRRATGSDIGAHAKTSGQGTATTTDYIVHDETRPCTAHRVFPTRWPVVFCVYVTFAGHGSYPIRRAGICHPRSLEDDELHAHSEGAGIAPDTTDVHGEMRIRDVLPGPHRTPLCRIPQQRRLPAHRYTNDRCITLPKKINVPFVLKRRMVHTFIRLPYTYRRSR
jgi:hypothetical protein